MTLRVLSFIVVVDGFQNMVALAVTYRSPISSAAVFHELSIIVLKAQVGLKKC